MSGKEKSRLSRLTAILLMLQSKQLLTAAEIAEKYNISIRTVYRDIRALEEAGVPVYTEEGKGYSLMDGYRLPPVMFSENEANALITAGQLVLQNKDASFVNDYTAAILKIKAVLRSNTKGKTEFLSQRVIFRQNHEHLRTSNYLSELQLALTSFSLVKTEYQAPEKEESTIRIIEPFAIYSTQDNWLLIAFCRLRNDYRSFRLDRIKKLETLSEKFEPHKLSLQEYFEICRQKSISQPLT